MPDKGSEPRFLSDETGFAAKMAHELVGRLREAAAYVELHPQSFVGCPGELMARDDVTVTIPWDECAYRFDFARISADRTSVAVPAGGASRCR